MKKLELFPIQSLQIIFHRITSDPLNKGCFRANIIFRGATHPEGGCHGSHLPKSARSRAPSCLQVPAYIPRVELVPQVAGGAA